MNLNVGKELAALRRKTVNELRARFAEAFGETTNARHKDWLVKRIIWRLQALDEGDRSERARRRAAELANDADPRRTAPKSLHPAPAAQHAVPPGLAGVKFALALPGINVGLASADVRRYLTSMKTIVSSKGQIVLPVELRDLDRIRSGQRFDIERLEPGRYLLTKTTVSPNEGVVDWLLGCPTKGWFEALPSESTDTL